MNKSSRQRLLSDVLRLVLLVLLVLMMLKLVLVLLLLVLLLLLLPRVVAQWRRRVQRAARRAEQR